MANKSRALQRITDFGDENLNILIDEIIEAINQNQKDLFEVQETTNTIINLGPVMTPGQVIGLSGGTFKTADASSGGGFIRAAFVSPGTVLTGGRFEPLQSGSHEVLTDGNGNFTLGNPAFLSTSAGVITSTAPTAPNKQQIVGIVAGPIRGRFLPVMLTLSTITVR